MMPKLPPMSSISNDRTGLPLLSAELNFVLKRIVLRKLCRPQTGPDRARSGPFWAEMTGIVVLIVYNFDI